MRLRQLLRLTLKTEAVAVLKVWLSITDQFDVRYIASQIPYGTAMLVRLLYVSQTSTWSILLNAGGREVYPAAAAARSFQTTEVQVCEEEEYRSYHATGDHEAAQIKC